MWVLARLAFNALTVDGFKNDQQKDPAWPQNQSCVADGLLAS